MPDFLVLIAAYLIGSLSGSLLLGKLRGIDVRTQGSGNAGGTNAFRTQGWRFALGVVLIDVGKGVMAAALAEWLGQSNWVVPAAVLAAVAGHVWPLFFGFRGGKGAATLVGGVVWFWPLALLPVLLVWLICLTASGYVGLSTILAAASLIPAAWWLPGAGSSIQQGFALAAALLVLFTHRSNLQRLWQGNEHRFERVRIWRRRSGRA